MTTIIVLLVTLSLGPIFSINHPASAKLTHSKNVECTGASHTQNFSDRYHLGKVDCQAGYLELNYPAAPYYPDQGQDFS